LQDKVIQAILRHSNVSVTQRAYIKTVDSDAVNAMQKLEHATNMQLEAKNNKSAEASARQQPNADVDLA
jgi:hypothetical protein